LGLIFLISYFYFFVQAKTITIGTSTDTVYIPGSLQANSTGNTVIGAANVSSGQFGANTGGGNYYFPANVGIGTTAPAQKLHVEGQCITGDSLLSVVSAKDYESGRVQSSKFKVQRIPIKDITPDYYVYSLNEETRKVELSKIKALLDMGIKPVFKLTTEDGRSIRTTGNHPYLVRLNNQSDQQQKIQQIQLRRLESLARSYGISQEDLSEDKEFSQIRALWLDQSVKEGSNFNNTQHSRGQWSLSQARIPSISLFSQRLSLRDSDLPEISNGTQLFQGRGSQAIISTNLLYPETISRSNQLSQEDKIEWRKVIYLQPGDEIAVINDSVQSSKFKVQGNNISSELSTLNLEPSYIEPYVLWEKIKSIEFVGYEQVYDIEVEGTHNFVANGIIAHNTYISGNVGIGTTSPGQKLTVAGIVESTSGGFKFPDGSVQSTAFLGGSQTINAANVSAGQFGANTGGGNYYFPANVGIGTATPAQKLHVEGNCVTGDSLLSVVSAKDYESGRVQSSKFKEYQLKILLLIIMFIH